MANGQTADDVVGYSSARIVKEDLADVYNILDIDKKPDETAYKINTPEGLVRLATAIKSDFYTFEGVTIYLSHDLDMSEITEWEPIGTSLTSYFAGTFDGQGHVIDNLVWDNDYTPDSGFVLTGIFGVTHGATIKNLVIGANCSITYSGTRPDNRNGILVGAVDYSTTFDNVLVQGTINAKGCTGSLVGHYWSHSSTGAADVLVVKNCTNTGNVTANSWVGGLVGYADGQLTVENCRVTGNVIANEVTAGGIVGNAVKLTATIDGCIVNGDVTGSNASGGILGKMTTDAVTVQNCVVYGTVAGTENTLATNVGAIVGENTPASTEKLINNQDKSAEEDTTPAVETVTPDFNAPLDADPDPDKTDDTPSGDTDTTPGTTPGGTTDSTTTTTAPADNNETNAPTTGTAAAPAEEEGGCASAIGGLSVLLVSMGVAVAFCRKKKNA